MKINDPRITKDKVTELFNQLFRDKDDDRDDIIYWKVGEMLGIKDGDYIVGSTLETITDIPTLIKVYSYLIKVLNKPSR